MSNRFNPMSESPLEDLSAFADGQLKFTAAMQMTAKWRDCEETRKAWHAYHLIGDVLRSDELASGVRDEAFLRSLRTRLAQEPVVLAPPVSPEVDEHVHTAAVAMAAGGGRSNRRRRWGAPVAVAAGFMVAAGALVVTRVSQPVASEAALAVATPAVSPEPATAAAEPVLVVNGELVRDAQLDRYLSAHKQFGGSTALGVPSGFLRSATYEAPSR